MTKLTTERLEKFVNDIKTDGMCDITDHQVALALRQLMAYEQAAEHPAARITWDGSEFSVSNVSEDFLYGGTAVYLAPVLPKQPEPENKIAQIKRQKALAWLKRVAYENPCMKEVKTCIEVLSAPAQPVIPEQQQPIAYIFKHPAGRLFWSLTDESNQGQADVIPVYADPHELKIPPAIEPDYEVIKGILPTANPDEYACCIAADMWNACRAEMLKAQPVSEPYKLPSGWKLVPIEPTPKMLVAAMGMFTAEEPAEAWGDMIAAAPAQESE